MENVWITLAEIQVEPGDMSSGDTLGFMWVTMWQLPRRPTTKTHRYLTKYRWSLLSTEKTEIVDASIDRGDDINQMIDETRADRNAVHLVYCLANTFT